MSQQRKLTCIARYADFLPDCPPPLHILAVNARNAADSVIVLVQTHSLPAKVSDQLTQLHEALLGC